MPPQSLALNFDDLRHARAFRNAIDAYVKQCTKAVKNELIILPTFQIELTTPLGVTVATSITATFHKTRSRARGRHAGETIPETLSRLFGGSGHRGAPVRAAFLSLIGTANLAAAVSFLNLPPSGVATYIPAAPNHASTIITTIVSALYKREFPCPPKRHAELAHKAALPAMAAMATALIDDCTAFVPLNGFQALYASIYGRAPTDEERAGARIAGELVKNA